MLVQKLLKTMQTRVNELIKGLSNLVTYHISARPVLGGMVQGCIRKSAEPQIVRDHQWNPIGPCQSGERPLASHLCTSKAQRTLLIRWAEKTPPDFEEHVPAKPMVPLRSVS